MRRPTCAVGLCLLNVILWGLSCAPETWADGKPEREAGEFKIILAGKEIGTERFEIVTAGDKTVASSQVELRNAVAERQTVRLETHLEATETFVPTAYQLKTDVDGRKGTIKGSFAQNQAIFEYIGAGAPRREGLLTGKQYTLLDTNVFHHFAFLARLFKYDSSERQQQFEVVIPQETVSGRLTVTQAGREALQVRGKKTQAYRLHVDSGALQIDIWVTDRREIQRITVPLRRIEIDRVN